ncbi:MAG: hypothetical protein R3C68_17685 [Myxococcota bacterium]
MQKALSREQKQFEKQVDEHTHVVQQATAERHQLEQHRRELDAQQQALLVETKRQEQALAAARQELDALRTSLTKEQKEVHEMQRQITKSRDELAQEQKQFAEDRDRQAAANQQLTANYERRETRLKNQRQQLAEQLKKKRRAHREDIAKQIKAFETSQNTWQDEQSQREGLLVQERDELHQEAQRLEELKKALEDDRRLLQEASKDNEKKSRTIELEEQRQRDLSNALTHRETEILQQRRMLAQKLWASRRQQRRLRKDNDLENQRLLTAHHDLDAKQRKLEEIDAQQTEAARLLSTSRQDISDQQSELEQLRQQLQGQKARLESRENSLVAKRARLAVQLRTYRESMRQERLESKRNITTLEELRLTLRQREQELADTQLLLEQRQQETSSLHSSLKDREEALSQAWKDLNESAEVQQAENIAYREALEHQWNAQLLAVEEREATLLEAHAKSVEQLQEELARREQQLAEERERAGASEQQLQTKLAIAQNELEQERCRADEGAQELKREQSQLDEHLRIRETALRKRLEACEKREIDLQHREAALLHREAAITLPPARAMEEEVTSIDRIENAHLSVEKVAQKTELASSSSENTKVVAVEFPQPPVWDEGTQEHPNFTQTLPVAPEESWEDQATQVMKLDWRFHLRTKFYLLAARLKEHASPIQQQVGEHLKVLYKHLSTDRALMVICSVLLIASLGLMESPHSLQEVEQEVRDDTAVPLAPLEDAVSSDISDYVPVYTESHLALTRAQVILGINPATHDVITQCLQDLPDGQKLVLKPNEPVLEWTILPDGQIDEMVVRSPALSPEAMGTKCVIEAATEWEFPPAQRASYVRNFPLGNFASR